MNRAERRSLEKQGASKETISRVDALNSPCTITECVQISRGVAEDAITDYHRGQANLYMSMSLQVEILKEVVLSAGLITEEEFRDKYMKKAQEIQEMQKQALAEQRVPDPDDGITDMKVSVGDVEIKTEA